MGKLSASPKNSLSVWEWEEVSRQHEQRRRKRTDRVCTGVYLSLGLAAQVEPGAVPCAKALWGLAVL